LFPGPLTSREQYTAALHTLRERSGLSFRQIERVTARNGPIVLPASTLATILKRGTLPRADVVRALVQACGGNREAVTAWLRTREALLSQPATAGPAGGPAVSRDSAPRRSRWRQALPPAGAALVLMVYLAGGAAEQPAADAAAMVPAGAVPVPVGSASLLGGDLLKLAHLCLSERHAHDPTGLIVLADCERQFPPRRLAPDGRVWRVRVEHPTMGPGCMGVVSGSPEAGTALSDDMCDRIQTDRFHLYRVGGGYLLSPEGHRLCAGVTGTPRPGAPVVQLPCDARASGQVFTLAAQTTR
jgi:hypothetical protein